MTDNLIPERRAYVAGRWVDGDETIAVESPAEETTFVELSATPLSEVERAITEARRSFDSGVWAETAPVERARVIRAMLDYIAGQKDPLVASI